MSTTQINNHQSLLHLSNCEVALDETVRNTIFIANSREAFRAHENWIWRFILTFCFFGVYHERSRMVKEKEKKNAKLIFILFFFLQTIVCSLPFGKGWGGAYAQTYPVQITTQLTPPFSGYISDYATPGNQNLKVLVYLTDFTMPLYDVKLKVKIDGQGITLQSKPFYYSSPVSLVPGQPLELSGSDLAGLLNSNNLDFSGISKSQYELRKVLPEGYYKICFTAYDNNNPTQIKVSNESCAMAWMVLSDPPFLNTPVCNSTVTITNPQNILFNWTPMNMASPNSAADTEYGFSLYEVRPDGQNPNNIIQTLPPVFTTTVNTPFLNYGITETPLIAGMQYVWRVRAIDVSGRDLFKNQGYSQICTFNWGTKYDGMGNLDLFLGATPLTHRSAKLVWDSIPIFTNYHLEYRKAGGNWNWMPVNTSNARTKVFDLEPETEYEAHVNGTTNDGYTGQWSNVASFRTPPTPIVNCEDVAPPPSMKDFQPLTKATVGSIWEIGQFEVIVTSLQNTQSTSGQYSGQGRVLLPFGGLGIIGNFTNLTVNNNHVVVAGHIDALTKGVDKWQNNFDQLQAQENATYVDGTITSVTVNSNGEYCYTTQSNPQPICVPTPTNANVLAVRDSDGNEYTITLVPLPAKVTGPKNYLNNTTDNLEITDSLTVTFEASSNQSFGFDKKEYTAYSSNYEMYTTPSNKKYFIPYKSISEGQTDEVLANIQINNFNQANLSFKTQSGTALNSTSLTTTQFKITGIPSAAGCVYAYYNNKKIGKLNIVSLKSITKKLILVPVNNTTLNSQTQQQLNNIYKQANVSWNVTAASSFTFNLGGDGLEAADATLLTKYSTEMRALRDAYKQATPNYDKDAYYIFVVPSFNNAQLKGYMVRSRAVGFVVANTTAKEVAHELAHGAFGLEHTFPKIEQSTTNNLLDYGSGQQLIKMQWEEMRNPALLPKWEDSEEDASYQTDGHYSTIYLIGKMLGIPQYKLLAWYTEFPDNIIHDKYAIVKTTWAERDHQLATHALTNGYHSVEEFKTALGFLNANENDYQEMGRLLHRYGDCYAHTRISTRLLEDSLKMMYGMPTMIYLNGKIYFLDYTLEHMSSDQAKPDVIANDPSWYLKYVENVADLLCVKFNKQKSNLNLNLFQDLANYAKQKNVSLIGIIDYEIAKLENKKNFFIKYPMPQSGNLLSNLIVPITERDPYTDWIKNTEDYLKSKNIQYTISWKITYNVQGLEVINAPARFTIITN